MTEPAIELKGVWKRYLRGQYREDYVGILRNLLNRKDWDRPDDFWALRDVSFAVKSGESVGIIGANGAGKTTCLRLIAGVTETTRGRVHKRGRVASLIALGAGFHRELTGRENVYLNGVIMGMTRAEIRQRFDEIVAFAELEDVIDTPVKKYSTGMYARLGFAVAAHADPDILLIDEVLSVGDLNFQNKCMRRMRELAGSGRTVVFISHSMSAVQMLCKSAIWLDRGRVMAEGQTLDVIRRYIDAMNTRAIDTVGTLLWSATRRGTGEVRFTGVVTTDEESKPCDRFSSGQTLRICATYRAMRPVKRHLLNFTLQDRSSGIAVTSVNLEPEMGEGLEADEERTIIFEFPNISLRPGTFSLYLGIWPLAMDKPFLGGVAYDIWDGAGGDFVITSADHSADSGLFVEYNQGLVSLPYRILYSRMNGDPSADCFVEVKAWMS